MRRRCNPYSLHVDHKIIRLYLSCRDDVLKDGIDETNRSNEDGEEHSSEYVYSSSPFDLMTTIHSFFQDRDNSRKPSPSNSVIYYPNGDRYDGTINNGKKHGHGNYQYINGDRYVGEWRNDEMNGQGTFTWIMGNRYEGNYKDNRMHGQGTFYFSNGEKYVGEWSNNMRNGRGLYSWPNGNSYEGNHKDNTFHGRGKQAFTNGQVQKGNWRNNIFVD